jgi:hypothetical protein
VSAYASIWLEREGQDVTENRMDGLTDEQQKYLDEIQRRTRTAGISMWARGATVQFLWLVVVLAGAGIPLNGALGGPDWVEPTLGFIVVAAAGIDQIFGRTSRKAATVDRLRRALAHETRLLRAGAVPYADDSTAFATFIERCELAIAEYNKRVIKENRRLLGS